MCKRVLQTIHSWWKIPNLLGTTIKCHKRYFVRGRARGDIEHVRQGAVILEVPWSCGSSLHQHHYGDPLVFRFFQGNFLRNTVISEFEIAWAKTWNKFADPRSDDSRDNH